MDFQFVLPSESSELLNSAGDNYYVAKIYNIKEIPEKLKQCKSVVLNGDPFYIFDHFDTYFSVIENSKSLQIINILRSYDLLYLTVDKLGQKLATILNSQDGLTSTNRNSYLNLTKMSIYLITSIVHCLDSTVHDIQSSQLKKGKKTNYDTFEGQDWEQKRFKYLVQMYNIMQLPLEKLWDPPVTEENFVNLICDSSYRTLELYSNKERNVTDTVFQILGAAIKRYNHALAFPVRILQILRSSEQALVPTAAGILLLHDDFGLTSIFGILIKDIVETLSVDSTDSQIARFLSTFLAELGSIAPKLMIPHLTTLGDELLNCESHVLRNCILQIMGDVVTCELTSEELSDDMKEVRDEFLENLLLHINDVSAHVRSKVLQIWNHMKEQNAVPLSFQHRVLEAGVERLEDKTSTVRKSAVILIKSFLECNPFSAKLTLVELIKKHEEEIEKLDKLKEVFIEENKKLAEVEKNFHEVVPTLLPLIEDVLKQNTQEPFNSQENYEDMVIKISNLLVEKKYREAIVLAKQADHVAGNSEWLSLKFEEQCAYYMALLKSYILLSSGCNNKINEEFDTQVQAVKFLEDSLKFAKIITGAVPKIQEMLLSKTNSDVFEAVDFFTTGYLFGIKETECGIRRMLFLVWSSDKEKRDAVSNAYKRVLFTTDLKGRAHADKVVKNLCNLFQELNYGHYTAMETLIKEWVDSEDIDLQIIQVLFERFTMKLEDTTENESRQCLQILVLTSNAKASITTANIAVIEQIGFGERAIKDPRIYSSCLEFLLHSIPSESRSKYYKRYNESNQLVQKSIEIYQKLFFHPRIQNFDQISIRTMDFFYQLCQSPDVIVQKVIIDLHLKIKPLIGGVHGIPLTEIEIPCSQQLTQTDPLPKQSSSQKVQLPVFLISRFIHLIGYATMKEMIFLDIDVYNNLKYRQELMEAKKTQKNKKFNKSMNNQGVRKTINLDMSASESIKRLSGTATEPQQEPDEDLVGATAEDRIAELITDICENEILYTPNGILQKMIPIVIEICKYPGKYHDNELQQAACLALIRFMTVSSKFCEIHMPFLMNILIKTKNIKIKCNIVVGLSDLTFRFPNIIEPWTGHFYSTLHESNDELRLTAVKMLSHLILHEMIRVKGQIADLTMCIVDKNDEIKNITQQFFKEIANKSNILYNVLPDIISKLSDTNLNLEEEKYRIIMKYILGLIQKDRQVESLVEKLCLRFNVTNEERQWRDIAFCLSLLNYSEKTLKKLSDNIQCFKDKVQIDEVYNSFKTIINSTSKSTKAEIKQASAEFETRLEECIHVKETNLDVLNSADSADAEAPLNSQVNRKKPKGKPAKKKAIGQARKKNDRAQKSSSSSSESESSIDSPPSARDGRKQKTNHIGTKSQMSTKTQKKKPILIDEFSTSDEELILPQRKRGRN